LLARPSRKGLRVSRRALAPDLKPVLRRGFPLCFWLDRTAEASRDKFCHRAIDGP